MIDFTTIPLYEALPDVKALNYQNELLTEDNESLKWVITALAIGILIYWVYQTNKTDKKLRK